MRIIFLLVTLLCLVSCNEKKQPTEYKEPVDVTLRDADGVPMGFHKGYDGVTYYDNDISAPRKGETKEEYERRTESYRSSDNCSKRTKEFSTRSFFVSFSKREHFFSD